MNILITGSTQGIGFAFAREFLSKGHNVVISSRNLDKVNNVLEEFKKDFPNNTIIGTICDVTKPSDIRKLAQLAISKFGTIDIWVNNAGTSGFEYQPLQEWNDKVLKQIIETNMLGTIYGSKEAIKIMLEQGHGKIFNMTGMGANGMASPNLAAYGASKSSIPQLTKSLVKELKGTGIIINHMSPGIVFTDLTITNTPPDAAFIFNTLGTPPEKVAKFLVRKMLAVNKNNSRINYMGTMKVFWRFMTAGFRKGKYFDSEGNYIG